MELQLKVHAYRVQDFGYAFYRCKLRVMNDDTWIPKKYSWRAPEGSFILGGLIYWKQQSLKIRKIIKDNQSRGD